VGTTTDFRNTGLLSFGEAEEGSEEAEKAAKEKRKGLTRMDRKLSEPEQVYS